MRAQESPLGSNQGAKDLAEGKPTTSSVSENLGTTGKPALIGSTVENGLEATLWKLIRGDVELYHCTPALAAWWHLAHETGRQSRQAEIDRLNAENDRLYLRAYNDPKQVAEILQRRLDEHFEEEDERFFAGGAR